MANDDIFEDDDFAPIVNEASEQIEEPIEKPTEEPTEDGEPIEESVEESAEEEEAEDDFSEGEPLEDEERKKELASIELPELKEKKTQKKKKKKWSFKKTLLVLAILALLVFLFNTKYFSNYKQNFLMNIGVLDSKLGISGIFSSSDDEIDNLKKREENKAMGTTYDNESYMLPFEGASNAVFVRYEEGILAAKSNYLALLNDDGKTTWEISTSVVDPIMRVDGDYILLAEENGYKLCVYKGKELVYNADAEDTILNAGISSEGDAVVVTKKDFFKGAVEAYNIDGDRIFSWSSGSKTVCAADISPSKRRIAVGFINSEDKIEGSVEFFDVSEDASYKTIVIPDTAIYELDFDGEDLNVFGDNRITGLSVKGKILWDENYGNESVEAVAMDDDGNKVALIESNNLPILKVFSSSGREKYEETLDQLPDYVDILDNRIIYNNTRMVLFGKYGKVKKYAASMDIKALKIIDKSTFLIIYSNSIEFVKA